MIPVSIATMKVPIETLPVELRIKIYELGDVRTISTYYEFPFNPPIAKKIAPWARTSLMSGILNDKDAIEIAAIQGGRTQEKHVQVYCNIGKSSHDEVGSVRSTVNKG